MSIRESSKKERQRERERREEVTDPAQKSF
jgi:hypothetical protein